MVGSAVGSILIADLAAVAGDRYNHQGRPRPVNVFIDESAEVVNDRFIQLLNKGRGAGLRLVVAAQTFADFAARTGSEAKARQVLGNINNLVALRVLDAETQEYVAESLPKTRVVSIMRSHGSTTDAGNPVLYTGNTGERVVEEDSPLIHFWSARALFWILIGTLMLYLMSPALRVDVLRVLDAKVAETRREKVSLAFEPRAISRDPASGTIYITGTSVTGRATTWRCCSPWPHGMCRRARFASPSPGITARVRAVRHPTAASRRCCRSPGGMAAVATPTSPP